MSGGMRRYQLAIAAIVAVGTIASGGAAYAARSNTSDSSVAYKLAAIDCKCVPSSARVRPYAKVLAVLAGKKCRERQSRLGDLAVTSTRILAKKQIRLSTFQILRGVNQSIPSSLGRTKCIDIFVAFVTLVEHR